MEHWKTIEGFDKYQISSYGNVKNKVGKLLGERIDSNGYNRVRLYGNEIKNKLVHRLVADAFIPNQKNKKQINHKDGDKLNNNIDNLEWVTHSENQIHRYNELKKGIKGIKLIKDGIIYEFESLANASRELNLDAGNLSRLNNNKRNHYKGYKIFKTKTNADI
jgi:hypothetical protein